MKNGKNFGILTKFKIVSPGMKGDAISIPTKTRFTMPETQYGYINLYKNVKTQTIDYHRSPELIILSLKSHKLGAKIQMFQTDI